MSQIDAFPSKDGRGGKRAGSGRKSPYGEVETTRVVVPAQLVNHVQAFCEMYLQTEQECRQSTSPRYAKLRQFIIAIQERAKQLFHEKENRRLKRLSPPTSGNKKNP